MFNVYYGNYSSHDLNSRNKVRFSDFGINNGPLPGIKILDFIKSIIQMVQLLDAWYSDPNCTLNTRLN